MVNNRPLNTAKFQKQLSKIGVTPEQIWAVLFNRLGWEAKAKYVICPCCHKDNESPLEVKRTGKLRVDYPTPRFHCVKCNKSSTKMFAVAYLLGWFLGMTEDEILESGNYISAKSYENILELLGVNPDNTGGIEAQATSVLENISRIAQTMEANLLPTVACAPNDVLDTTYRNWFDHLCYPTNPFMVNDLKRRGFSDGDIVKHGFVSTQLKSDISNLLTMMGGKLDGVPGLYREGAMLKTTLFQSKNNETAKSYICPVKNIDGQIVGGQVRTDNPDVKYFSLSSAENGGASANVVPHFSGYLEETAIITEGVIKANLISKFTNRFVIGLPGVNSQKSFLAEIRKANREGRGIKRFIIAYDMDRFENEHVQKALDRLKADLTKLGFACHDLVWDSNYKGFDDYLYHLYQTGGLKDYLRNNLDPLYYSR